MSSLSMRGALGRAIGIAGGVAALMGARVHANGAIVLTYHDVTDDVDNPTDVVAPDVFREQLERASRFGLRFVPLAELVDAFSAGRSIDGLGAVAFDDALEGVYEHAFPILLELGVPATVFAVSGRLSTSQPSWFPGAAPTMSASQLRELAESGIAIGSHTATHPDLAQLPPDAVADELGRSRTELEAIVDHPVEVLAYPFGHYTPVTCEQAKALGYRAAFTLLDARITHGLDPFRLPRLAMWSSPSKSRLAYALARPPSSWPPHQPAVVS